MEGSILSVKVNESVDKEIMESGDSVGVSYMLFSVCLGMECLVLIFRAWIEGTLHKKAKNKDTNRIREDAHGECLLLNRMRDDAHGVCLLLFRSR